MLLERTLLAKVEPSSTVTIRSKAYHLAMVRGPAIRSRTTSARYVMVVPMQFAEGASSLGRRYFEEDISNIFHRPARLEWPALGSYQDSSIASSHQQQHRENGNYCPGLSDSAKVLKHLLTPQLLLRDTADKWQ